MSTAQETIYCDDFAAEVIRTRRKKTVAVRVVAGKVSVVVPRRTSRADIEALVRKKSRWIREKLLLQATHPPPVVKRYVTGECVPYLGQNYRLDIVDGMSVPTVLQEASLQVAVPARVRQREAYVRAALADWYRQQAMRILRERATHFAPVIGAAPTAVQVRAYKSRWGSCSVRGEVKFNWKIVLAPQRIIDYVVVHELCHLKHFNHSAAYWRLVESVFADFRECRIWLRRHGAQLEI